MNERPITIITTRLPPQICGIGTYSWLLFRHWPTNKARTGFLVVEGGAESRALLQHSDIAEFHSRARELSRQLEGRGAVDLILHYAGRAYQRYGCPIWFPNVLQRWKTKFPDGRLFVFFHELPGDFPIISQYFWIDFCNQRVIRKLAKLADVIVTNTEDHRAKLEKISGRRDAHVVPVGSNIESREAHQEGREADEFVIFGLPFGRWQTLQMFAPKLRSWQDSGVLTKLHVVGPRDEKFSRQFDELLTECLPREKVVVHGLLSASDVSRILGRAGYCLTNITRENWSKSVVFMACALHRCAVVSKTKSNVEPLRFTVAADEVGAITDIDVATRTTSLKAWYAENADWSVIAKKIHALLIASVEKARHE